MSKRIFLTVLMLLSAGSLMPAITYGQRKQNDLEHERLKGKVKTIRIDSAKITNKAGTPVEGKKAMIETRNYSESGMLMRSVYVAAGQRSDSYFSYDASGSRLQLLRNSNSNRSTHVKTEFKYDANGNRVEANEVFDDGWTVKFEYFYNADGNCVEKKMYKGKAVLSRRIYAFGPDGNVSEETEYDSKGEIVSKQNYTYELDSTGNWTKRMKSAGMSNGKQDVEPAEVTYRTITYY